MPIGDKLFVVKNFGWLVAEKMIRLVFGLGIGLLVARHLGPNGFGELNYALALTGLLVVLAEGGLEAVVKRDLIREPESTAGLMAKTVVARFTLGLLAYAALALAVQFCLVSPGSGNLLLVVGILVFQPLVMVPDLWFHARLDARRSVLVQLVALVVGSGLRVILVTNNAELIWFAWVVVGEMAFGALLLTVRAWGLGLRLNFVGATGRRARSLWREAWPLLLSGVSISIYMRIDAIMLKHLVDEREVGLYAAATRLSEFGYFIPTAIASSVLPALIQAKRAGVAIYNAKIQAYFDLNAGLAYLLLLPLGFGSGQLVRSLYGEAFAAAGGILVVHIWAMVFVFLGVARGQWLVNEGLTRFYLLTTLGGAVANVAMNFVLIPIYGGVGAAWATVVSYAGAAWLGSYFHPLVRDAARMQAKALLIPFRFWGYLVKS